MLINQTDSNLLEIEAQQITQAMN